MLICSILFAPRSVHSFIDCSNKNNNSSTVHYISRSQEFKIHLNSPRLFRTFSSVSSPLGYFSRLQSRSTTSLSVNFSITCETRRLFASKNSGWRKTLEEARLFVANRTCSEFRGGDRTCSIPRHGLDDLSRTRTRSWYSRRTESLLSRSSGRRWRAERHTWRATVISIRFASEPSAPSWDPRPSRRWIHPAGAPASSNLGSGRSYEQTKSRLVANFLRQNCQLLVSSRTYGRIVRILSKENSQILFLYRSTRVKRYMRAYQIIPLCRYNQTKIIALQLLFRKVNEESSSSPHG